MPFRPEAEANIAAEAARKPTDTIGWSTAISNPGPNTVCRVSNADGFLFVFTVLASEGLSLDEVYLQCTEDTITEVRLRRHTP